MFTVKIENGNEVKHALEVANLSDLKVAQAFIVDEYANLAKQRAEMLAKQEEGINRLCTIVGRDTFEEALEEVNHIAEILEYTKCSNLMELHSWIQDHEGDIEDRVDEFVEQATNYNYSTLQDLVDNVDSMQEALNEIYGYAREFAN